VHWVIFRGVRERHEDDLRRAGGVGEVRGHVEEGVLAVQVIEILDGAGKPLCGHGVQESL